MSQSQKLKILKAKVSAHISIDLVGIKEPLKNHLFNLEANDESNGLLTVYCFNTQRFIMYTPVTKNDIPPIYVGDDDIESCLFQSLHPEMFAALAKVDTIKSLNPHARLLNVNTGSDFECDGSHFYILEMLFEIPTGSE